MSKSFGEGALRLFSHAARLLGWKPDDFWAATPAELVAALMPPAGSGESGLARADLERMMEQQDG